MSRKRTLYISELLKRFDFKSWQVKIFTKTMYEYYISIEEALTSMYIDSQVRNYYITDNTFIIYI